jgi:hypothetical protein
MEKSGSAKGFSPVDAAAERWAGFCAGHREVASFRHEAGSACGIARIYGRPARNASCAKGLWKEHVICPV